MPVGWSNTIPDPKYILVDCLMLNLISAKDLEVTINNKLSLNARVSIITCKANARGYLIHKYFISRIIESLVRRS